MTNDNMRALFNELGVCVPEKATKSQLEAIFNETIKSVMNINVSEGATKKQVEHLICEYFKTAALVTTGDEISFRQTDKPVAEYVVDFTINGHHTIMAESEETAHKWVKENILCTYETCYCKDIDLTLTGSIDINRADEDYPISHDA